MDNETWYYQYGVRVLDEDDFSEQKYSGIVFAKTIAKAVKRLTDYYGEKNLLEIISLKPLTECPVFDFNYVSQLEDFDFTFCRKL